MLSDPGPVDRSALDAFIELIGQEFWAERLRSIRGWLVPKGRASVALRQYHAIELALDGLRRPGGPEAAAARRLAGLAANAAALADELPGEAVDRLRNMLRAGLRGNATLIPSFHLLRTAALQTARGFAVSFAGLTDRAAFDLLLSRDGAEAEIACDIVSAESGRAVQRGAWVRLADRIDADLQTWLAAHPGRYILKMTLPQGLQGGLHGEGSNGEALSSLHGRIRDMLASQRRGDRDEAVVLRLDPLLLAAAQADELGLMPSLRREFGPEAHLSVTSAADRGVFVLAARAAREDEVAAAIKRRLAEIAPRRLSGARPGILAMFIEDTDSSEWRGLRDRLELEGETRQFLTRAEARGVVAVTCASRLELFDLPEPLGAEGGELRFRNHAHPAAKVPALAPAVLSTN